MTAGDYDLRGDDMDQRFARFGLRPLSDADVWALGMATMVMPDGNPGAEAYLAQVSGTTLFTERLTIWGRVVALGVAQGGYKAPNGRRRRAYVECYDESWGRYAVADGLTLALYGKAADAIGKSKDQGYRRVRDFVGGALVNSIAEFRIALEWATGARRDRVLEGRWESITGLNFGQSLGRDKMDRGESKFPMFAPGCSRISIPGQSDYRQDPRHDKVSDVDPQTLYHGLRPCDWWDEAEARRMRTAPVTMIYPGHG